MTDNEKISLIRQMICDFWGVRGDEISAGEFSVIPRKLRENYIYKVGIVYGNVIEHEKPIIFYFEKVGGDDN